MRMETEELPPDVLLAGILAMAEAQGLPAGIEVVYEPEPDLPAVPMDVEKLKQVLLNAFRNGVDAMRGSGGKLTVRSAHLDGGQRSRRINSLRQRAPGTEVRIKRGHLRTASCVEISFEDQGIGINAKDAPNLFIPFFTTKAGGTGLGLAISERIVRLHGGEIEIESVRGEGTRFSVRLPVR
jgi:signal transduction histidine kinase